jgi:hypothetical protein
VGQGGGLFASGQATLTVASSTFSSDRAAGGSGGSGGSISNTFFGGTGGAGGVGGAGQGGGLFASVGTFNLTGDSFSSDTAIGGSGGGGGSVTRFDFAGGAGGAGGAGQGGGLFANGGTLNFSNDAFNTDAATGGTGGDGGRSPNRRGAGGNGGAGQGGGFFTLRPIKVTQSSLTFIADQILGGVGGLGNPNGAKGLGSNKDF